MKQYSCTFDEKNIKEIYEKTKDLNYKTLLVQVYSGVVIKSYILNVVSTVKEYFPNAKIVGITTDGEIIDSKITQNNVVVSFSFFEKSDIEIVFFEKNNLFEDGKKLASKAKKDTKLLMIFASGIEFNADDLIEGINFLNPSLPVIGSLAGDNAKFKKTYIFYDEKISKNGVLGVYFNSEVLEVYIDSSFGWVKFGRRMKITKSDKNIVYEIDEQEAFDVYSYYLGNEIKKYFPKIGVEFPLIKTVNNLDVARAVVGVRDKALIFAGALNEGDIVNFGIAEASKVLESSKRVFQKLLRNKIEALFVFSCMARRRFVEKLSFLELQMLKNIPNTGFFGYGEFFNGRFLNQTLNVLALSEGGDLENKELYIPKNDKVTTIESLIHLVDVAFNEVRQKLYIDNVTKLPNKAAFDEDVLRNPYGAVLFDIKKFSSINDKYGEVVGDEVLKNLAKILQRFIIKNAKLYRISADYFIVLFFEECNLGMFAYSVIEYFYNNPLKIKIKDEEYEIDLDLYAALVEGVEGRKIKIKADMALHYAKVTKENIVKYSKDLKIEEKINKEIETLNFVKKAIMENRVIPVFQMIQKDDLSFEALVRIIDEDGKLVSPFYFLDSIKNTRYYDEITRIMIEKSFKIFQDLPHKLSINFSYEDIQNEKTVEFLISSIEKYNMQNRVIIEVLETDSISEYDVFENFVKKVKKYGVEIAIDDFGSGYSNFIYLANIKPDYIKIDGSLIKSLDENEKFYKIVKTIVEFAKEMDIRVIAEFVKDEKIYEICKKLGIDGMQGYFIHIPSKDI
ncbi:bifunctional diguanylate cyclase/phosphodiesterase [Caminibacter pacificus]